MADLSSIQRNRAQGADEAASLVREACIHLPAPERAEDFAEPFDSLAEARVVLLGEATHGSSEFYRARAAITRRLIERHGFKIVAVEADWPDASRVDRHVRHRGAGRYNEQSAAGKACHLAKGNSSICLECKLPDQTR